MNYFIYSCSSKCLQWRLTDERTQARSSSNRTTWHGMCSKTCYHVQRSNRSLMRLLTKINFKLLSTRSYTRSRCAWMSPSPRSYTRSRCAWMSPSPRSYTRSRCAWMSPSPYITVRVYVEYNIYKKEALIGHVYIL